MLVGDSAGACGRNVGVRDYGCVRSRRVWVRGPTRVHMWVRSQSNNKNNSFLAETLSKFRFLWSFHIFSHHAT
jgi:hypothetical protein